jgi:hypothetical protein
MRGPARFTAFAAMCGFLCQGCDWVQDRFRECGHMQVDLVNSDQSIGPVSVLVEDEQPFPEAVLESGASRRRLLCVERGDAKRFRAMRGSDTLATANCVVSRSRYEYETTVARVVWDPRGLVCENW